MVENEKKSKFVMSDRRQSLLDSENSFKAVRKTNDFFTRKQSLKTF